MSDHLTEAERKLRELAESYPLAEGGAVKPWFEIQKLLDSLSAAREKIDELECTLADEEAAHAETLRMLDVAKARAEAAEKRVAELELQKEPDEDQILAMCGSHWVDETVKRRIADLQAEITTLRAALATPEVYAGVVAENLEREWDAALRENARLREAANPLVWRKGDIQRILDWKRQSDAYEVRQSCGRDFWREEQDERIELMLKEILSGPIPAPGAER